ncbi:Uncharacterised protein [Bordetella pertussis]|nr:Uncharacterised protein [Bordetella pertussis]
MRPACAAACRCVVGKKASTSSRVVAAWSKLRDGL